MPEEKHVYCKMCNKLLKTPIARQRGYGYKCYKKFLKEIEASQPHLFTLNKETKE